MSSPLRCRWHTDDGRCLNYITGEPGLPDLCGTHLEHLRPWVCKTAQQLAERMRQAPNVQPLPAGNLSPAEKRLLSQWQREHDDRE